MPEVHLYPNELEFLDKNRDRFEDNDTKWLQSNLDHGQWSRIILLWAYLSGNLVIHYYNKVRTDLYLAIKGYNPNEEDSFPIIADSIDNVRYWMSKDLKFSFGLIDKILKSAKEV